MKKHKLSLFIFRRDLRLHDNTALYYALENSEEVIPCFIFDPRQVGRTNRYKSNNAIQFMLESLVDLEQELQKRMGHLYRFYGQAEKVVKKLLYAMPIEAVYFNKDYTPFSIKRDRAIVDLCKQNAIECFTFDDALLVPPENIVNKQKKPYRVFTPFFKAAQIISIPLPQLFPKGNFYTRSITIQKKEPSPRASYNADIAEKGGRNAALAILKNLKIFKNYAQTRDMPSIPTTHLSAHLKFGTISAREVHAAVVNQLGIKHPLIRQLYWRDFFTYITYHFPHVFGHAFREEYDNIRWNSRSAYFKKWCQGKTGFPIVDAGMRQLNTTGYMHNRVRMIVASFLVKDLHINWQKGEQYFAQQLMDYDPALNNGNWQWCASTGADAQPYFRIFNPWLQQKKFDPTCTYIKTWVPELQNFSANEIHNAFKKQIMGYCKPIVDHKQARQYALSLYKKRSLKKN
jgi:deoxyribodipyrimidine photo-lyase